jgi:hypothetical protein
MCLGYMPLPNIAQGCFQVMIDLLSLQIIWLLTEEIKNQNLRICFPFYSKRRIIRKLRVFRWNGKRGLPLSLGGENSDPSLEESESVLKTSTVRIHPTLSYLAAFTLPPIRRFSLRFTTRFPPSYLRVNLTCASHSRYWIQLYANQ